MEITPRDFTEKDGLAFNSVTTILEDDSGNLWIGTRNGLSKFNINTEEFRNYGISDGFKGCSIVRNSVFKGPDGEMIFGSRNGFSIFHPDNVQDDLVLPQV